MNIKIVEESNPVEWKNYLKELPDSPFLSTPWLESFKSPKHNPLYLRFVSGGKTIGVAAGLSIEPSHPLLRKVFRIIFLFTGPAIMDSNSEIAELCLSKLISYASNNKYTHLVMKSWDSRQTINFENLHMIEEDREEYIIDLSLEWSDIQNNLRKSIREQTRRAERSGLTFHESSSPEVIEDLLVLLEETKQRRLSKGYKNYSYYYMPFLENHVLYKLFKNDVVRIFYVMHKGTVICVLLIVAYDHKAHALLTGSNEEAYKLRAPAFIMFNTIKKLKDDGFKYLNLGGIPEDSSRLNLIFAKTSLSGKRHFCRGGTTPHLHGPIFNLMNKIYGKIPGMIKRIITNMLMGKN